MLRVAARRIGTQIARGGAPVPVSEPFATAPLRRIGGGGDALRRRKAAWTPLECGATRTLSKNATNMDAEQSDDSAAQQSAARSRRGGTGGKKAQSKEEASSTEEGAAGGEAEEAEDETAAALRETQSAMTALKEQRARLLAEMENTRMIARRDVENANQFGITSFAKALLDVSDNLSRALDSVPQDKLESADNRYLKELYIGVEMTRKELMRAFKKFDVHEFGAKGDKFDPNVHQAMFQAVVPGEEAGSIISVNKTGFMLNSRLLRAAEVGVAKEE